MYCCICGSREFTDYDILEKALSSVIKPTQPCIIVSGAARGADKLGEIYAEKHDLVCLKFPADWDKYGKKAGMIRNSEMANCANRFFIFWDGLSLGTRGMLSIIKKLNKPYHLFNLQGDMIYEYTGKHDIYSWLA